MERKQQRLYPSQQFVSGIQQRPDDQVEILLDAGVADHLNAVAAVGAVQQRAVCVDHHGLDAAGADVERQEVRAQRILRSPRFKKLHLADGPEQLFEQLEEPVVLLGGPDRHPHVGTFQSVCTHGSDQHVLGK